MKKYSLKNGIEHKIKETTSKLERKINSGGQTESNLQEYRIHKEKKDRSNESEDLLDTWTFVYISVEILLVFYLILALGGYVPMF